MISIERARELIKDKDISGAEVEQIRDEFRILAEIIFEKYQQDRAKDKNKQ